MKKLIFEFYDFFGSGHFFDPWDLEKYQKMTGSKKVINVESQFFHACQPREGIFEIQSYWGLIFTTDSLNFEELFPSFETFFQNFFLLKWFQMVSTLTGLMPLEIRQP